jgi:hypothetical protein
MLRCVTSRMRIARRTDDHLVLTQSGMMLRLGGLVLLSVAIALVIPATSEKVVRCEVEAEGPICSFIERTIISTSVTRVAADDVVSIEVSVDTTGDDDTHCAVVVTRRGSAEANHELGLCSSHREAHLDEEVQQMKAFYAGRGPGPNSAYWDKSFLWFIAPFISLFGLGLIFVPGTSRVEVDRAKRQLTLQKRTWLFGRRRHGQFALKDLSEVSVQTGGEDGDEHSLVLHMKDGQSVPLNEWRNRSMAEAQTAISEFLNTPTGYR